MQGSEFFKAISHMITGSSHLPQVVEPRPDVGGDARHAAVHQVIHKDVFFPAGKTEQYGAAEGYVRQMVRHAPKHSPYSMAKWVPLF